MYKVDMTLKSYNDEMSSYIQRDDPRYEQAANIRLCGSGIVRTFDYDLFRLWMEKFKHKGGDYSIELLELEELKKYSDLYGLCFLDLIDELYPDKEEKLSEVILHLRDNRELYDLVENDFTESRGLAFESKNICGYNAVLVFEDDLDEFFP